MDIKVRVATQIQTFSANDLPPAGDGLRHCQDVYINGNSARRYFKRRIFSRKPPGRDSIFAEHEANTKTVDSALPSPTSPILGCTGFDRTYNNTCTSGGDEESEKRAAIAINRWDLLRSINNARQLEGAVPLILDEPLSNDLQGYADIKEGSDEVQPMHGIGQVMTTPPTIIMSSVSSRGQKSVLLISPPGLGGAACGELWHAGKYKCHASITPSKDHVHGEGCVHPPKCSCHGRKVFDTMVRDMWKSVGIARFLKDGRWLVELVSE